jgi:hypothetical protein
MNDSFSFATVKIVPHNNDLNGNADRVSLVIETQQEMVVNGEKMNGLVVTFIGTQEWIEFVNQMKDYK